MAITGTFDADFSPFVREVNRGNEALRKFERGQRDVETASASTESRLRGTAKALDEVDGMLNLFGVHLGPVKTAVNELANAADDVQSGFGALGVTIGVVGAAFAGWKLGRWIAELGGLDEKIGDVTAHLLGMKTAADEAAEANADAIKRAQGQVQGLTVLTAETAALINKLNAEDKIAANQAASDIEKRKTAYVATQEALAQINADMKKIKDEGLEDQLRSDINAHAVSLKDLAKEYAISDAAMNKFAADADRAAAIEAANAEKIAGLNRQATELRVAREKKALEEEEARKKRAADELHDAWAAQLAWADARDKEAALQQQRREDAKKTEAALREERLEAERLNRALGSSFEYDLSTPEGLAQFQRMNPTAQINAPADYFKSHTLAQGIAAGYVKMSGGVAAAPAGAGPGPGGSASADYGLPPTYYQSPAYAAPPTVVAPVYVSGVFDPASATALGRTVGTVLGRAVSSVKRGRGGR